MKIKPVLFLVAILAIPTSVPAHAQADAPTAERPVWPPPGSTLTMSINVSGSLGSGTRELTAQWLGEVTGTENG